MSFVRFEGQTYAVTATHVITAFAEQASKDGVSFPESYFLPSGRGIAVQPPFVSAPINLLQAAPDVSLRRIDDDLPAWIDKEAFELLPDIVPPCPVPYAGAVGFPTFSKFSRATIGGTQLLMQCVHAVAEGVPAPADADQVQFFSEVETKPELTSLSGLSGGPVFWSDGNRLGLLGFVKQALDVVPPPGEETLYSGPRVHFLCERASYESFGRWIAHANAEWPRLREALNNGVQRTQE